MNIFIVSAIGQGKTKLSAFDSALTNAGIHNYNLLKLSSIIPPRCGISVVRKYKNNVEEFGHKLYVVQAEIRSDKKGIVLSAGIGWYQLEDGRGFFVEHEGSNTSERKAEKYIQSQIYYSLQCLCLNRKLSFNKENVHHEIVVARVENVPTSVMVSAVYQSEGW